LLSKILKWFMAFKSNNVVVDGKTKKSDPPTRNLELTGKELEFFLNL